MIELAEVTEVQIPALKSLFAWVSLLEKTVRQEKIQIRGGGGNLNKAS